MGSATVPVAAVGVSPTVPACLNRTEWFPILAAKCFRPEAVNCGRDARAPQSNCIVLAGNSPLTSAKVPPLKRFFIFFVKSALLAA